MHSRSTTPLGGIEGFELRQLERGAVPSAGGTSVGLTSAPSWRPGFRFLGRCGLVFESLLDQDHGLSISPTYEMDSTISLLFTRSISSPSP